MLSARTAVASSITNRKFLQPCSYCVRVQPDRITRLLERHCSRQVSMKPTPRLFAKPPIGKLGMMR